jgi:hypothetical protein
VLPLLGDGLLIADEDGRVTIDELLVDEGNHILKALELTIASTADMLNTATPAISVRLSTMLHDQT